MAPPHRSSSLRLGTTCFCAYVVFSFVAPSRRPALSKLNMLSIDFHISPIRDVKDVFERFQTLDHVRIIDKSLSGHCHLVNTCATDLRIITKENGISLSDCPNEFMRKFWTEYRYDRWFNNVDIFYCDYPISLCEVYMAFNKPMILVAPTRYEIGRHDEHSWQRLNENLQVIASSKANTLAANNLYDLEYMKHFTGISNIQLVPNLCLYVDAVYRPRRKEILIGPSRLNKAAHEILYGPHGLFSYIKLSSESTVQFVPLRKLYEHYTFKDLAQHQAMLVIPYQVSIMSLFEYYAMQIPMLVPSLDLLVEWQVEHLLLEELSWNCVFNKCPETSVLAPHENSPHPFDPNDVLNPAALRYWLKYADFYQWPGIIYFHSWDDLLDKVQSTDFADISRVMGEYNQQRISHVKGKWEEIIDRTTMKARTSKAVKTGKPTTAAWEEEVMSSYPNLKSSTVFAQC